MNTERLRDIRIQPQQRSRQRRPLATILVSVAVVTILAALFAWPKKGDERRVVGTPAPAKAANTHTAAPKSDQPSSVLTVSGYIVNRARIEISPRLQGLVTWIGVKKGDLVTRNQLLVTLDDAEQKARVTEAEGRLASAKAELEKAELDYERAKTLRLSRVESQKIEDDARVLLAAARASLKAAEGTLNIAKTQLDWTMIRSPIDGVVLEKLVDPGEMVTPQSFGGARGPSTALLALADPNDLQVEIDVNESDLPKVSPGQECRVSPEAYPDKSYEGFVAEVAPEANRQKGTLQINRQIVKPDKFLTPELSARVDFIAR
jgi:HlyD family secretion protein